MKSLRQFSFVALALMFALASCRVEKRVYTSGYHVEWNTHKQNPNKVEVAKQDNEKQAEQTKIARIESSQNENKIASNAASIGSNNITAPVVKKKTTSFPERKIALATNKLNTIIDLQQIDQKIATKSAKSKITLKVAGDGMSIMAILGFACSVLGLILLFAVGFPCLMGLLGIIFSAIGLSNTKGGAKGGRAFAIAGLILGIVDILLLLVLVVILASIASSIIKHSS